MSNALSQEELDALLNAAGTADEDPNAMMTPAQSAALLASSDDEAAESDPGAMMTPDQIAALLQNQDAGQTDAAAARTPTPPVALPDEDEDYSDRLSAMEIDAMGEIGNISMGTGATTLFALLNRRVDITTPRVRITTMQRIAREYPLPFVAVEVSYTHGLEGTNILFLRELDVKIITDLLMGGDGTNVSAELSDLHLSAICEVMNQMVGSASTSLAKLLGTSIDISPPTAYRVHLGSTDGHPYDKMDEVVVRTGFDLVVEGLINSEIMQVTPIPFAKRMVEGLLGASMPEPAPAAAPPPQAPSPQPAAAPRPAQAAPPQTPSPQPAAAPPPYQAPAAAPPPAYAAPPEQPYAAAPPPGYPPQYPGYPPPGYPAYPGYPPPGYDPYAAAPGYPPPPPQRPAQPMVDVRAMQFESFDEGASLAGTENLDLLMDVPLQVSVELGKTRKSIKEILDYNVGTIVVLDKMAGEMIDIVVNGKLIAKGEVVVIDENYGARITDIISPSKRINTVK
jgi:flagellar motor switch protein FliN/FliY